MKKVISNIVILALLFGFSGCLKSASEEMCTPKSVASEKAAMQAYADNKGYAVVEHTSGLLYEIIDPGTGATPNASSVVKAAYVGRFISNDQVFDQTQPGATATFPLSNVIDGWTIAIPLLKEGGTIRIIIPSSLAYGCRQYYTIPPNSVLFFEVTLVEVN